jgi:hypothetical protein
MNKCTVDDCNNKYYAKGYCKKHYSQIYSHGRLTPELERGKLHIHKIKEICSIRGCNNIVYAKGLCGTHYNEQRKLKKEKDIKMGITTKYKCKVDSCNNVIVALGYCKKHYKKFKKYGETLCPIKKIKICQFVGCNDICYAKGYCQKHYSKFYYESKIKN